MQRLAAQVEEAIAQADILGVLLLARHRQRQLLGAAQHGRFAREHLDRAGRQVGIDRPLAARLDHAVDRHHAFDAQPFEQRQGRAVGIGHDLGDPVVVAQVDEQHAAVITLAMDPARQADGLALVRASQRAAGV